MVRCPACNKEQHGYKWTRTRNNKKWLMNSEGKWHKCETIESKKDYQSKPSYSKERNIKLTWRDFDFCDLCSGFLYKEETVKRYPQLHGNTLTEHLKIFHKNNEILDDIDFMVLTDEEKEKVRKEWNYPKREKKYQINGKLVV